VESDSQCDRCDCFVAGDYVIPLVLVVMCGGYLSYRYNMMLKNSRDLVVHTYQVISSVERMFSDIQDAETGQRGFIITGDDQYLEPYQHARDTIPDFMREVRQLVADRPDQVNRLDELDTALQSKFEELKVTIDVRRNGGFDGARIAVVQAGGKASMDRIRNVVAQMISTENDLLSDRMSTVVHAERNILWIVLVGAGVSIVFRSVVGRMLSQS
jgi:CHASE3 domain sensor protein